MTVMASTARPAVVEVAFDKHAKAILGQLRSAISSLLAAIPGDSPVRTPTDLQKALGVHYKLAWQIHRIATASNPVTEANLLPGAAALQRFFESAARCGVPDERVEAAMQAVAEFEELVRTHAGDRSTFGSMVSGLAKGSFEQVDLTQRRAAFKANSHILGLQASAQLVSVVLGPGREAGMTDCVAVRGYVGLRRLRPNTSWIIAKARIGDDNFEPCAQVVARALDVDVARDVGVPFLTRFCSQPLPKFTTHTTNRGWQTMEVGGSEVGNLAAMTYFVAERFQSALPVTRTEGHRHVQTFATVRLPEEVLVQDMLVYSGLFGEIVPTTRTYTDVNRDIDSDRRENEALDELNEAVPLGAGCGVLQAPEIPRYCEMMQYVFDKMGWNAEQFEVYRRRVEYPVVPSSAAMQFNLPEKPER